jgi:DNA replication and repair protein RecF
LHLTRISLTQFRNYSQASFVFNRRVVGVSGANGVGKTNLLDAIHFLCFTRSYFSRTETASQQTGMAGFRIQGFFEMDGHEHEITRILRENGKKELWVDREQVSRFSKHIGRFPVVFIAPDDIELVTGGAEERRKFLDALLSQLDEDYLQDLIRYEKILQERNGFLKKAAEQPHPDFDILDIIDDQLVSAGSRIYQSRKAFLEVFIPQVSEMYAFIAGRTEIIGMRYQSSLDKQDFRDSLQQNRQRDLALQRTMSGVHRDDLEFDLNGLVFKQSASQGQRKSLLFALKLSEFSILRKAKGYAPILLLDDIFEKLDAGRMENLLQWVCRQNDGQVFLTDTHAQRIRLVMEGIGVDCQLLELTS